MAQCKVYGTKPDNGPGSLSAHAVLDQANHEHATWHVTLAYNENLTTATYTSATATAQELESAFMKYFPGYHVIGI